MEEQKRGRLALKKGKPQLTKENVEEIRGVFNLFVNESTGLLESHELLAAMRSLGSESGNDESGRL